MKILIISPTYNEHANVATLIERIFSIDPNYHLLIVDDSSPDGTGDIVKRLKPSFPNLHLETRKKKNGLGRAYIYGFKWALKRDYDAIVQMDADMSHDPMDIPQMAQYLDDFDMVIGSRYVHGVSVVNWPIRRLIMSYGANLYSRIATGMPLKDATGG
jgi:dolichol-phosphate mannosyltransferase